MATIAEALSNVTEKLLSVERRLMELNMGPPEAIRMLMEAIDEWDVRGDPTYCRRSLLAPLFLLALLLLLPLPPGPPPAPSSSTCSFLFLLPSSSPLILEDNEGPHVVLGEGHP